MRVRISAIAAIGENRELGRNNQLLWHIPEDLQRFRDLTSGHAMIMGRKTFESIGRVLPNRTNIIISRDPSYAVDGAIVVPTIDQALEEGRKVELLTRENQEIFIIGGGQIFKETMPVTDRLYLTIVHKAFPDADVFYPAYDAFTKEVDREEKVGPEFSYTYLTLEK